MTRPISQDSLAASACGAEGRSGLLPPLPFAGSARGRTRIERAFAMRGRTHSDSLRRL